MRNTLDGEQQRKSLFQAVHILALAQKAVGVVVLDECHHMVYIGVEVVVHKRVVHTVEATPPVVGDFVFARVHCLIESEVHHRFQIAVFLRQTRILLPSGGVGWLCNPSFAHGVEVRIFLVQFLHPARHRSGVGVGVGVHTNAVDAHGFHPPDAVLNQISGNVRIVLVKVGH